MKNGILGTINTACFAVALFSCQQPAPAPTEPTQAQARQDIVEKVDQEQAAVDAKEVDEADWNKADGLKTVDAYLQYQQLHPEGNHKRQANDRINELMELHAWETALTGNTRAAYEAYIGQFPTGAHHALAVSSIDAITQQEAQAKDLADWNAAVNANNVQSFEWYKQVHPGGAHTGQADVRIWELTEASNWSQAVAANTVAAYEYYIAQYEGKGPHTSEARLTIEKLNTCNCSGSGDQFMSYSDHSWVRFRMPALPMGSVISVNGGAYNHYKVPKCNRVHWSDLVFTCKRGSDGNCNWEKTSGSWDADALCHGSKGDSPYVEVGDR